MARDVVAAYKRNEEIANMAHDVLLRMKIPMHYQYIAKVIKGDYGVELDMSDKILESRVLRAINTRPEWFERTREGVYIARRSK